MPDMMTDIRINPRNLLLLIGLWACFTFLMLRSRGSKAGDCAPSQQSAVAAGQQRVSAAATGTTIIYAITPTYARPVQKAELTR